MTNANKILKICAMYNSIKGKQSFFMDTCGATGSGKTFEDKHVLSCFDSSDIITANYMTYASLFREKYGFNKKTVFLGDMNDYTFKSMKKVFNVFKTLIINHEYSRIVSKKEQKISTEGLCVMYETIKNINNSEQFN